MWMDILSAGLSMYHVSASCPRSEEFIKFIELVLEIVVRPDVGAGI